MGAPRRTERPTGVGGMEKVDKSVKKASVAPLYWSGANTRSVKNHSKEPYESEWQEKYWNNLQSQQP